MPPKASDVELLLNKAALHQARLRKALGLPDDGDAADKDLMRKEDELFKSEPELAGLGYKGTDQTAELKRKAMSSDDRLRRQLLGKNSRPLAKGTTTSATSKKSKPVDEVDSDDEEGRASSFRSKRSKGIASVPHPSTGVKRTSPSSDAEADDADPPASVSAKATAKSHARRPTSSASYLDELLEQKAKKRKKKRRKESNGDAATDSIP